ncbi:unnamed protein product [Amaranthus hypochondriacus]
MARKKPSTNSSPLSIGNCEVLIEGAAKNFKSQSNQNSLLISASKGVKIKISVMENVSKNEEIAGNGTKEETCSTVDCGLLVIHPKDADSRTKSLLQEILSLYTKELPGMNYAANTGKQSSFLERCVSNGKFCTLVLSRKCSEDLDKVIAAITYQIVPADTRFAEIPLAAVNSSYHCKGVGRFLYAELRKRFQEVGISTVLCWGDKESEGFWHKQGFVSIAEVDSKGKAQKLPIRADIRRALCFPGGSTLMVSHLNKNLHYNDSYPIKLCLESAMSTSSNDQFFSQAGTVDTFSLVSASKSGQDNLQQEFNEGTSARSDEQVATCEKIGPDAIRDSVSTEVVTNHILSTYERNRKRRVWESSSSSLNFKRVKAAHISDPSCSGSLMVLDTEDQNDSLPDGVPLGSEENIYIQKSTTVDISRTGDESDARGRCFNIMLMDIANGPKKAYLTKIVEDLGGTLTADGSLCTHVLAGRVRRTLNFCTALCSGAWVLTPHWLKECSRKGRFIDELPFLLKDDDYLMKFRVELKDAVHRAKRNPRALLKGYNICLTPLIQPPIEMLSTIIRSAGGDVNVGFAKISEKSRTIFIACEEDMDEALLAVKSGVRTFSSEWLMNCIMKQELDLDAPQFAESL